MDFLSKNVHWLIILQAPLLILLAIYPSIFTGFLLGMNTAVMGLAIWREGELNAPRKNESKFH
jgi:hypothetical protein